MRALTDTQARLLRYIREYHYNYGFAPSVREMGTFMGISSTNGVLDHLKALERKGQILRMPYASRCIATTPEQIARLRQRLREERHVRSEGARR